MITYLTYLEEGYSGIKRSAVGTGLGGALGSFSAIPAGIASVSLAHAMGLDPAQGAAAGFLGGLLGATGGQYFGGKIGKNIISNPDDPIDERSRLHRVGALLEPHASGYATVGNLLGGGLLRYPLGQIGAAAYNASDEGNAAKLGYGTTGKIGQAISPIIAGLTTPKKLQAKE